jgi:hypothetical protein
VLTTAVDDLLDRADAAAANEVADLRVKIVGVQDVRDRDAQAFLQRGAA